MKLKALAVLAISANLIVTSFAQAQQWGVGYYGGAQACPYPNGAANGATDEADEMADMRRDRRELQREQRQLEREVRQLERQQEGYRANIDSNFRSIWAPVIREHIERGMNCEVCGEGFPDRGPRPRPQPMPYPPQDPPPSAPPQRPPYAVPQGPNAPIEQREIGDITPRRPTAPPQRPSRPAPGPDVRCPAQGMVRDANGNCRCSGNRAPVNNVCPEPGGGSDLRSLDVWRSIASIFTPSTAVAQESLPAVNVRGPGTPVSAGGAVHSDNPWASEPPAYSNGAPGESGGALKCYARGQEPYGRPSWNPRQGGICRPDGGISPNACRTQGYINAPLDARAEGECVRTLDRYRKLVKDIDEKRNRLRSVIADIDFLGNQIADLRDVRREMSRDMESDGGERTSDRRGPRQSRGNNPSFMTSLINVGLPLAAGVGMGLYTESQNRRSWNQNNESLTALGWPTLPYQSNGAGYPFFQAGIYGAIAGASAGAYGCGPTFGGGGNPMGPMGMGGPFGMNAGMYGGMGGPFGNPYGQYGMPGGGGMYNPGMGPWGMGGPGGMPGMGGYPGMVGGMVGAMMGGMQGSMMGGYPGMMGGMPGGMMGGYPGMMGGMPGAMMGGMMGAMMGGMQGSMMGGYPGMMGGMQGSMMGGIVGAMVGGFPGGQMGGGFPGGQMGGGFPGGYSGYMGYMAGGFPGGQMGGGYPGMMGGYPGGFPGGGMNGGFLAGMPGDPGAMQYQQQMMQLQMEYQTRMQDQTMARYRLYQGLSQEYTSLMYRFQQLSTFGLGSGSSTYYDPSTMGGSSGTGGGSTIGTGVPIRDR